MQNKDYIFIAIIGLLSFMLLNKKKASEALSSNDSKLNIPPAGNKSNGGLNLGSNMDLPSLTPTPKNGMTTEGALNNSNVQPLVNNEPTQIFGSITLPQPYYSTSIINANPIDVITAVK